MPTRAMSLATAVLGLAAGPAAAMPSAHARQPADLVRRRLLLQATWQL